MARKRTDSYWARRSAERLTLAEQEMEPYLEQVIKAYEDAKREVINDLRRMYAAYYGEDKSFNMIALNSIAPKGDIRRFRDEMKRRGLNTKLPDNYGGRITRLELIEGQLQAKIDRIGRKVVRIEGESHRNTVESSFYHSIYDISRGLGATPAFTRLNEKTINKILETKFEGKNYSERIWGNTNILAQQLREKLAKAIATGQSLEKTTREFRERFGVGESYAKRLIRTETNYFENTAEIESYEAMGIEYFVFVATLDDRTSEICQSMDGEKFKVKDAVAGDNYPPLHPNCRSTIRAYIGKDYEPETRVYRDPETGQNKYTYNVPYEKWAEQMRRPELIKNTAALYGGVRTKTKAPYVANDKKTAASVGVTEKYWNNDMEASERQFARSYTQNRVIEWIDKNSRLDPISGRPLETNDYFDVTEKIEYELKTPLKKVRYSSIAKMVSDAAKSGYKKNFMINLGERKATEKLIKELEKYNERHKSNPIDNLKVWSRNIEHKIKLK